MPKRKKPSAHEPAPAVRELMDHGWCRRDADHLVVLELALSQVRTMRTAAAAVLSDHAATALAWEPVLCGARSLYVEPEHAAGWRALAGYQDGPSRTVMLQLAAEADACSVTTADDSSFTAEDLRIAGLASQAQDRGEFAEALRLLRTCTRPLDDPWVRDLERLLSYGEELTPAQWGRWICSAALRWCQGTGRGLDLGVHFAAVALRALGASDDVVRAGSPARAGYDQIVHDALLFDEGALRTYLTTELAPVLAERVPGLERWPDARLVVVRLLGRSGACARVEDVLDGRLYDVAEEGLADQHPAGRLFTGRLVQVDGDDRWCFAMLPTVCDEPTVALELAKAIREDVDAETRIDLQHRWMAADAA